MDPIQEAIRYLESREAGDNPSYRKVAIMFGVERSTLARRHQGQMQPRGLAHLLLHPQQEMELVEYIKGLTARHLPPTREMIRNFASAIAHKGVSDRWVSRFLHRNHAHLTTTWVNGMDHNRHKADSGAKYKLYFDLLHAKMAQYEVEARHIYNMDEKGFLIGITARSKRVFSRELWERKEVRDAIQDGSRSWITVLACVCADGTAIPPGVIYQSNSNTIQSSWVDGVRPEQHSALFTSSPTGWSNNEIGVAWLQEVFDRFTKPKARSSWRLLILDGHGSHVLMDFISYCDQNKILLAVFPPHSTHSLQPLDVVLFKPLSSFYSKELSTYLHNSQGLLPVRKGDFFHLFWTAWCASFTEESIKKAFEVTGIHPPDPHPVLKRFEPTTPELSGSEESSTSCLSGDDWRKIRALVTKTAKGESSQGEKKLQRSLHHIATQNELLRHEIQGLRTSLTVKERHKKRSFTLQDHIQEGYHGGAVFWSPKRVLEARAFKAAKQVEKDQLQLQKIQRCQEKEQQRLSKLQQDEQRRVERERAKEVRVKEKAAKAAERAAQKAHQKEIQDSKKAIQLSQKGKRKASQAQGLSNKRQKAIGGGVAAPPSSPPPTKTTRRGRNINLPSKYK